MMSKKWIATLILVVVLPLAALAWHRSSWNVWEQLPPSGEIRVVLNPVADTTGGQATALTHFLPLPASATHYLPHVQRLGYSQTGTQHFLLLAPKVSALFSLPTQLVQDGWHVERSGLLIRAWDGNDVPATPNPVSAFFTSLAKAIIGRYNGRPWAVGSVETSLHPALPSSFRFSAQVGSRELLVHLTQDQHLPHVGQVAPLPNPEVYVSLPGEAFSRLSPAQEQLWSGLLQQKLHFTHTKPAIIAAVAHFSRATVALDGTSAAISVQGDTAAFIQQATTWLQEEDSHSRFVKKAFRLPDKTVGYEDVPGDAQAVLQPSATDPTCLIPQGNRTTLVLCRDDSHAVLATSTDYAKQFLTTPRTEWELSLRGPFLAAIPVSGLTKMAVIGSSEDLVAHLWW
jgi:hypothetical protein